MENQKQVIDLEGKNLKTEVKEVKKEEPKMCPFGTTAIPVPSRDRLGQPVMTIQQITTVCMGKRCKFYDEKWEDCLLLLSATKAMRDEKDER